VENALLKVCFK